MAISTTPQPDSRGFIRNSTTSVDANEAYLTDVLTKLVNNWPNSRLAELTPWGWSTAH
jgi:IS66 C-terminal element